MLLYNRALSGHCWKIRLMLGFLGLAYETREVDTLAGESQTEAFRRLNPRGHIPVLVDDGAPIWDSQAILGYLARRYGPDWLPLEPAAFGDVLRWLAVAGQDMQLGARAARAVFRFGLPGDLAAAQAILVRTLTMLDDHLAGRDWLAAGRATIADVAIYPYASLSDEAGVPLAGFPRIVAWTERFRALPGYVALEAGHAAGG